MHPREALEWLQQHQFHGIKPGLERISALLEALGRPQERFPSLHIAGTNGKGSTAALLQAILSAHGLRTGLYTSPHLVSVTERFRIDGREITLERLADILARIRRQVERLRLPITYFEITTAAAFLYFAEEGIDMAVIECGLGGRLDATNVLKPRVAVITSVALDHMAYLGRSLERIAREKAGILKPGLPVVAGHMPRRAREVIRERAFRLQCPAAFWGQDFRVLRSGKRFSYRGNLWHLQELELSLEGEFQKYNLGTALRALEFLRTEGYVFREDTLRQALKRVSWPGRFEFLPVGPGVILDGAHNEEGTRALLRSLERKGISEYTLIFGATNEGGEKPYLRMLQKLISRAKVVFLCEPPGPRNPVTLKEWEARKFPPSWPPLRPSSLPEALDQALSLPLPVVITGSLYLVGAARRLLLS
ncbi:folylpolyglutamate synthase/dihydrofolate synthase family protein [Thermosulfurimonas sp.]|uniref:bifunctional folylpolyglutamate synthase/dihydrofolate synthase n=1 Tax=Thermosulfurimonas sp. TaxID=2080236 RepID=UPI0025E28EDB|nr:folylpolyglutamate synthase/dihydrofolate synthase family protein [Thermosulfurimonas sp.]